MAIPKVSPMAFQLFFASSSVSLPLSFNVLFFSFCLFIRSSAFSTSLSANLVWVNNTSSSESAASIKSFLDASVTCLHSLSFILVFSASYCFVSSVVSFPYFSKSAFSSLYFSSSIWSSVLLFSFMVFNRLSNCSFSFLSFSV